MNKLFGKKTVIDHLGEAVGLKPKRSRVIEMLRARYAENATSTSSCPSGDGYSDIRLGD